MYIVLLTPQNIPMILGTLEFSNGQKCQWNQYKKSCEAHQSCGECLSAYPDLSDDSRFGSPCVWCTNCGRGRCVPKGTNCTQFCLNDLASSWRRETLIEKSNQCPEMQCAASDCDKCSQLNRIGELKSTMLQKLSKCEVKVFYTRVCLPLNFTLNQLWQF